MPVSLIDYNSIIPLLDEALGEATVYGYNTNKFILNEEFGIFVISFISYFLESDNLRTNENNTDDIINWLNNKMGVKIKMISYTSSGYIYLTPLVEFRDNIQNFDSLIKVFLDRSEVISVPNKKGIFFRYRNYDILYLDDVGCYVNIVFIRLLNNNFILNDIPYNNLEIGGLMRNYLLNLIGSKFSYRSKIIFEGFLFTEKHRGEKICDGYQIMNNQLCEVFIHDDRVEH